MSSGIYKISCGEKFYIGSSKNIEKRWKRHIDDLNKNKHINIKLQRVFNKYGLDNFKFEVIELCKVKELLITEQKYLKSILPFNENVLNISTGASGGDNLTNNPKRIDIINRIKESVNYNISNMTTKGKKEKWGKIGKLNPNYGNRWSDKMKLDFSNYQKSNLKNGLRNRFGKTNTELYGEEISKRISEKLSFLASQRIGEKNGFYGKNIVMKLKIKLVKKEWV